MKARIRYIHTIIILLAITFFIVQNSCKEDIISEHGLDAEQLIAGRIDGTWANPTDIVVPDSLPDEIFGDMRLVFTTDNSYPSQFYAENCPVVFSSSVSNWSVSQLDSTAVVTLEDISPVDSFIVKVNSSNLIISFYMGWENTDSGDTGEGNFSVTLSRQ